MRTNFATAFGLTLVLVLAALPVRSKIAILEPVAVFIQRRKVGVRWIPQII